MTRARAFAPRAPADLLRLDHRRASPFVTMAIGVNARTAFSLLFPPILDEFRLGPRRRRPASFSFGFFVSAFVGPFVGRLMDREGPALRGRARRRAARRRASALRPLAREPWHFYADARPAGRRRRESPRLRRAVAVHPELVRAPARARDRHRVLRRRHRIDHPAALAADRDRARRLALGLPRCSRSSPPCCCFRSTCCCASARRRSASIRTATPRPTGAGRARRRNVVDPAWAAYRMDARTRAAHRARSGGSRSATSRSFTPGTPCRCTRPSI